MVKIGRREGPLTWDGEQLIVGIDAPPINGAANQKLIGVISQWLGVGKSMVQVVKGQTARYKTLEVGISPKLFADKVNEVPLAPKQERLF